MNNSPLSNITPEERQEMVKKAQEKRLAKKAWAESNLNLEYADENHWRALASEYSYRMPNRYEKAGSKFVNRFLKAFGLDKIWYEEYSGFKNGNEEARVNPKMNAVQQIGLLLEQYDEDVKQGRT